MTSKLLIPGSHAARTIDAEGTTTIRAREVREMLKGSNVDPKVQKILETLAEANYHNSKQNLAAANALNMLADSMVGIVGVAERMKEHVEKKNKETEGLV